MGNPTTELTANAYVHKQKRGKNVTKAKAGACKYESNNNIDPQSTTVAKYTRKQKRAKHGNPAIVGSISTRVVTKCRNTNPASAGITSKRVGG